MVIVATRKQDGKDNVLVQKMEPLLWFDSKTVPQLGTIFDNTRRWFSNSLRELVQVIKDTQAL